MGNRQKHGLFEKNRGRELRKTEPDCKKPRKIGHSCMLRWLVPTSQPTKGEVEQLLHGTTLMISRDFFMQVPPDPLDRVTVRAAARQEVQLEPLAVIPQVDHYRLAPVELGIVADDVD